MVSLLKSLMDVFQSYCTIWSLSPLLTSKAHLAKALA